MLSQDELTSQRVYDRVAADYATALPDLSAETAGDRALITQFARRVRGTGFVVDAGCGSGRVASHLTALGVAVVGLDLSRGMLAKARELHPSLPLLLGSISRVPLRTGTASGLLAWYSIIHTAPEDLPRVVAELARVLAVGAPVLLAFQCGQGERIERSSAYGHQVERTNYHHEVDHVAELLTEQGITITDRVLRPPVAAYETTPQGFLLGARER